MSRRPTIADLAKAAGVSTATVDRVLNGRTKVHEDTARRVYEAANAIGYHAVGLIRQRLQQNVPAMRFGFLLHKPQHAFYQDFQRRLEAAVRDNSSVRGQSDIHWVLSGSPTEFASQIDKLSRSCDAVAAVASDCHQVSHAVADARSRGVPVFSMLSDFAQGIRESYVGTNNLKVGRAAAWMLARTAKRAGKVGIFVGGHRWHGHELRETGFRSYFREHAPDFEVVETVTNLENRQLTYESTLDLLARHPDISGFYCAGGGMEGAIEALREEHRGPDLSVIVNEVTPETVSALEDGVLAAVLATPLDDMCRAVVGLMVRAVTEGMEETRGQLFFPARLYIPESL